MLYAGHFSLSFSSLPIAIAYIIDILIYIDYVLMLIDALFDISPAAIITLIAVTATFIGYDRAIRTIMRCIICIIWLRRRAKDMH